MKNSGKLFEACFKKCVPNDCLLIRIPDAPQSFTKRSDTKFSIKNPYDFILFDGTHRTLFCLELKTTKSKSISFEDMFSKEEQNRMIHKHQIMGLYKSAQYPNVISGFILNFRDLEQGIEKTYFQNINDFLFMIKNISKQSFNEKDLIDYNAIEILGQKKRVHYNWDLINFLKKISKDN